MGQDSVLHKLFDIIVIDDDEGLNHLICKNLKRKGFKCIQTFDGEQAVASIKEANNPILILDYNLPNMNGKQVIQSIKEKYDYTPPFIVMTGYGDEKIAVEMMKLGAKDYITKENDFIEILTKKAERIVEELEKEEENKKFKKLLQEVEQLAGVGGWLWYAKEDKWVMSENWMALHGCSKKYFSSNDLLQIAHPEDANRIQKALTQTAQKGEPYQVEHKIIRQDNGEMRYIKAFGKAEMDDTGNVYLVSGAALDVTDNTKAKIELQESEEKFRSIFDNAAMGIFRSTPEGRYEAVNKAFAQILGFDSPKKLIDEVTDISKLYKHAEDREKIKKQFAEKGFVENYEVMANHPTNKTVWISINAKQHKHTNGQIYYEGTIQDITKKKVAEEKLKEGEQFLSNLFQIIPMGISTFKNRKFDYLNDYLSEITGYSKEELLNQQSKIVFPTNDEYERVGRQEKEQLENHGISKIETKFLRKDGELIDILIQSCYHHVDGLKKGVVSAALDITEQKKNELALRQNKRQLELRKNIAEAFVRDELDDVFHDVLQLLLNNFNSKFGYFGYIDQNGDLVCPSMTYDIWDECKVENKSVVFPQSIWTGLWGESLQNHSHLIKNKKLKVPNGHVPLKNAMVGAITFQGKLIGQLAFANNENSYTKAELNFLEEICKYISPLLHAELNEEIHKNELIKAKEKAEENEQRLSESLLDLELAQKIASIGNWLFNPEIGTPVWSDEVFYIYERDKKLGPPHIDEYKKLYKPDQYNIFIDAINEAIEKGKDYDIILNFESPTTGRTKWIRTICQPDTSTKTCKGYFLRGTIQDITAQKETEFELLAAKEKAEESDRLKSAFLANMSHEIRTPMNGILGFAELLRNSDLTGEKLNDYVDIINESGKRMLDTLTDLIDISRIETGQVEVKEETMNFKEEIQSLYSFFEPEARKKNLDFNISMKCNGNESNIISDRTKINSILSNLIKNAIKYTKEGSIEVGCKRENQHLMFFVKDTGIGIPKELQKNIFNRFIQAEQGYTRNYEGSGLGLSISKAYAEMLNGSVGVESEAGKGSTFYFMLPVSFETPYSEKPVKKEETQSTIVPKIKMLIAEDDTISIDYLTYALKNIEGEKLFAKNGIDAVNLFLENRDVDIILMDIKMPKMDGYEATRKIREMDKEVIIIAQTAYALAGDSDMALEAGCNDYISKPLNINKLKIKINRLLQNKN